MRWLLPLLCLTLSLNVQANATPIDATRQVDKVPGAQVRTPAAPAATRRDHQVITDCP